MTLPKLESLRKVNTPDKIIMFYLVHKIAWKLKKKKKITVKLPVQCVDIICVFAWNTADWYDGSQAVKQKCPSDPQYQSQCMARTQGSITGHALWVGRAYLLSCQSLSLANCGVLLEEAHVSIQDVMSYHLRSDIPELKVSVHSRMASTPCFTLLKMSALTTPCGCGPASKAEQTQPPNPVKNPA